MPPLPFTTMLLDVDGTLIDSNGAHTESWVRALDEHAVSVTSERIRPLIGMGGDKLLPTVAGIAEDSERGKAIGRRKKEIFASLLAGLNATRGARALLLYLREQAVDLVIATSAEEPEMRALLRQAGVDDVIQMHASKSDAKNSKPDPDVVLAAMHRSAAARATTVMLGDTPFDIEAASRAGIGAIALRCGGYWSDHHLRHAIEILDDPAALLDYCREQTHLSQADASKRM